LDSGYKLGAEILLYPFAMLEFYAVLLLASPMLYSCLMGSCAIQLTGVLCYTAVCLNLVLQSCLLEPCAAELSAEFLYYTIVCLLEPCQLSAVVVCCTAPGFCVFQSGLPLLSGANLFAGVLYSIAICLILEQYSCKLESCADSRML
jgi:hypothetical protein